MSWGSGAAPLTQNFIDDRLYFFSCLNSPFIAENIAGTPINILALYRSIAFKTSKGLNLGRSIIDEAKWTGRFKDDVIPKIWKNGRTERNVSFPTSAFENQWRHWIVFATKFPWVRIAPFGMPVVPPVYWRRAMSSGEIFILTSLAGLFFISFEKI